MNLAITSIETYADNPWDDIHRPQKLGVALDTGSSDLWVSFKTAGMETTLSYLAGEVIGQIATDTVTMGGFSINHQTFLVADEVSQDSVDDQISGIMGLAFGEIADTSGMPFWQALASGGRLAAPEMGFWLTRFIGDPQATDNEPGGVFTLGGTDSSLYQGDIDFVDIPTPPGSSNTLWQLRMTSVTVQGKPVPITSGQSALSDIDTGAASIGGPTEDVRTIWNAVPGSQQVPGSPELWAFPCTTNISVSLSFGGKLWPINPVDMNLGRLSDSSPLCLGAIFDLTMKAGTFDEPEEEGWVIGGTFLKNVYSVFRMSPPSIGF
ncbi:aspartic peptidase A1, partial [Infundibulicybe gibba]